MRYLLKLLPFFLCTFTSSAQSSSSFSSSSFSSSSFSSSSSYFKSSCSSALASIRFLLFLQSFLNCYSSSSSSSSSFFASLNKMFSDKSADPGVPSEPAPTIVILLSLKACSSSTNCNYFDEVITACNSSSKLSLSPIEHVDIMKD